MTNSFPLPIECLQLVITNLANKDELKTLAALLRVSKYVCLATLPILYEDPFVWFMAYDQEKQSYVDSSFSSRVSIIQLLFASVPKDLYSGLIKATYGVREAPELLEAVASTVGGLSVANDGIPSAPTSQHWPIDYLSYVRHFTSQDDQGTSVLAHFPRDLESEPQLRSYVEMHQLAKMYAENTVDFNHGQDHGRFMEDDPITLEYLALDIHREATWALCSPILEQLQSIVMPLSDIGRYANAMPRLSSLATVAFKLDSFVDLGRGARLDAEEVKKLGPLQVKRTQDLEAAVEFVRAHTAMFPGTLKQVHCPKVYVQSNVQKCPVVVLDRMLALLPTLIDPVELVSSNWKQFAAKVEHTNLAQVKTIEVRGDFAIETYDQFKSKPFLHRCLSLRKYKMMSLGPDSFKWAVQRDPANDQDQGQDQRDKQVRPANNLPPLEDVDIVRGKEPFGSELDDIGMGFGATLKTFKIHGHSWLPQLAVPQRLTIGRGWRMPVLSKLDIRFSSQKLILDPDFLCYCPMLKSLNLSDLHGTYDLSEISVAGPGHLPELANLVLVGLGALAFHPDTLHSTTELKALTLGSEESASATFVPSIQDIHRDDHPETTIVEDSGSRTASQIRRPKWTWDWYLPSLSALHLTVEFASHFQFRMLQGTPNLQELYLSIYSTVHPVERVLTKDDFMVESQLPDRGQENDADENKNNDNEPTTSAHDLDDNSMNLHTLPSHILDDLFNYLFAVDVVRREQSRPQLCRKWLKQDEEDQSAERLLRMRQMIMDRTIKWRSDGWCPCLRHSDGYCPKRSSQEHIAESVHMIEELVNQAGLQPELEAALANLPVWKTRERQEKEALNRYQIEHPNHLVVPSVKKLEIFGHWIMSDEVLEILLGRVFRNLKELNECLTEGYSLDTLVRVTQSMPWLESVHSVNPVNLASLSDECKLQPQWQDCLPFVNDARIRVGSALLAQLHTSWADTVLGGIVDYLPKCYAVPSSKLFIEYTSGHCHRRPAASFERSPCTCNIVDSSQRGKLTEDKGCAWVLKVDEYKASNNKVSNIINSVGHSKADNAHNIPQALDLLYSRYHGGPQSSDSNATVMQGIDIKNKKTRYIGISMWKVIKMIRFHYLKIGQ
ncbi:hypothetical protein BG005_011719 [Podila minutissima]|nr:hypothetical protein BG005_011719 [Podila minutissima]